MKICSLKKTWMINNLNAIQIFSAEIQLFEKEKVPFCNLLQIVGNHFYMGSRGGGIKKICKI